MDVASLIVKVSTTGVQTTQAQLDKLSATASNAQKSAGSLNLGMLGLTATLGLLTKEAIKMGDEWTNINSKLNLVTKTTQEFTKAQTELFNISQNTRTSLSASVELYRKLAVSTESLNISQNRLLKVTETINKAGIIGGGSKESINAALIQLGQGLASGALRGEELNSVLEQTPRLAKLIADGMGVQVGALKSLAEAGKITSETIIKAAEAGEKGIAKEFDIVQATISSAMDVIEGSITKTVGTLDSATGATRSLSMAMIELSKDINQNNTDIVATGQFIYATISRTIDVFNVLYESVENTGQIVIGHINLLAYGSLEVILTMLTKVTEGLNVLGLASDKGLKEAYGDLAYIQGLVANANNLIADSYDDLNKAVIKLSPTIEDRIKGYNAENKAITEKLELQKKELAQNQTKGKSKLEVEAELKLEKEKQEAEKKSKQQAIKIAENWAKRNIEITTNMAIAQQDELAKPFIALEAKYKEDLETFKGVKGAKERLALEYNAELERLYKDLTEKFNKEEAKKAEKSAEWQVKLLEASEKYSDEIASIYDKVYEDDTSIKNWYENQLEYLGKLSQESGATGEQLQGLLDKIEKLKDAKTLEKFESFKFDVDTSGFDNITKGFNGVTDTLKKLGEEYKLYTNALAEHQAWSVEYAKIQDKHFTNEIDAYSNIAGAAASMFEEQSDGYKVLIKLQQALQIVNQARALSEMFAASTSVAASAISTTAKQGEAVAGAAASVTSAGTGDPYTAPMRVAAMLALMTSVLAMFGVSGGGGGVTASPYSTSELAGAKTVELSQQTFIDKLDQQIELLEAIEKNGSAQALSVDLAKATFNQELSGWVQDVFDMSRMGSVSSLLKPQDESNISNYYAEKGLMNPYTYSNGTIAINSQLLRNNPKELVKIMADMSEFTKGEGFAYTGPFGQELAKELGFGAEAHEAFLAQVKSTFTELQGYLNDWAISVVESVAEIKDSAEDMKGFYDDITGTDFYASQKLTKAFEDFDALLGEGQNYADYLVQNINNIEESTRFIYELSGVLDENGRELSNYELLLSKNGDLIEEQIAKVDAFGAVVGTVFDSGVEEALNYMDAIEAVSEALATSRNNIKEFEDSFKTDIQLAQDLADTLGVSLANSLSDLRVLFNEMTSDVLGLTDAELELLQANKKLIDNITSSIDNIVSSFSDNSSNSSFEDLQKSFYATTGIWVDATKEGLEKAGKLLKKTLPSESVLAMFSDLANGIEEFAQSVKDSFDKAILKGDLVTAIAELTKLDNAPLRGDDALRAKFIREMRIEMEAINALSADILKSENGFDAISTELARLDEMFKQISSVAIQIRASTFDPDYAKQVKYAFGDYLAMFNTLGSGFQQLIAEGDFLPSLTSFLSSTFAGSISNMGLPRNELVGVASVMQSEIDMNSAIRSVELLKTSLQEMELKVRNGTLAIDDYNSVTDILASRFEELYSATQGGSFYTKFVKSLMEATSLLASNAIVYYFDDIRESVEALNKAGEEAGSSLSVASQAMNRLSNISQTFSYLAGKVKPWASNDSQIKDKEIASLIAQTAEKASSLVTTEQTEAITDTLSGLVNFEGVDSARLKQMAMLISETSAYDTGSFETAFLRLNDALIQGVITQDEYLKLFEISTDIYRDTLSIQEEQLRVLEDIRDYQKSLLLSDASGLNTVGRYNYASIETASLAQQAKDALLGGDVDSFNSLFSEYKDISSQFLDLSKDLSGNQATYMNDFLKVYSVIDELGNMVDGSHANGLDYVPFDGYRAELHKGERVQTASEVKKDTIITELKNELRELKEIFLKNTAETTRMSKAIQRVIPDGDAISVRTAV